MSASSHTRTGCNEITTTSGSWIPESYGIYNKSFIEATSVTSDDANHKGWAGADKGDEAVYLKDPQYFDVDNDPTTTGTKKKEPLRKGKWTIEEERYTNRVIEAFNSGSLKLTENDRGITLRAYLADKLGCDPMRITKKYTGASCLGKRVYHAHKMQHATKIEEVERTSADLAFLEEEFRQKLLQMGRRRSNSGSFGGDSTSSTISTPAIDALMKQTSYPSGWTKYNVTQNMSSANALSFQPSHQAITTNTDHRETHQPCDRVNGSCSNSLFDSQPQLHDLRWGHVLPTGTTASSQLYYHDQIDASSDSEQRQSTLLPPAHSTSPELLLTEEDSSDEASMQDRNLQALQVVSEQRTSSTTTDSRKVVVTERDSEAAHSLLGFFTHLERNNSQEDLVGFLEDVQKTAAVASTIPRMGSYHSLVDDFAL